MVIPAAVAERLQSIVETFCQLHGVWSCFWKQHETFVLEKRAGVVGNAAGFLRVKFTTQNVIAHVDLFGERIDAVEQESAEIQHGTGDPFNAKQIIDRKSTRLNSSHVRISYAVFCLKKKKKKQTTGYHDTLTNH